MNLEKCKVLTTADFGSTFQGLADEYSDVDEFSVVLQPLESSIFGNINDGVKHVDEHRHYALERFVTLVMKGSFDSVLLLVSQLVNCRHSTLNQSVFDVFYKDDDAFHNYVMSRQRRYGSSVMGVMNQAKKQQDTKHDEYGKVMVKKVAFMNRLYHFLNALSTEEKFDFEHFVKPDVPLSMLHVDDVLPFKRYTYKEWFSDDDTVSLYYKIERDFRKLERWYHTTPLQDSEFEKECVIRKKVVKFIAQHQKQSGDIRD